MKKTIKKIVDIKIDKKAPQSTGLSSSQIITRFPLKKIMDGRTKYGRPLKIISKIIWLTFFWASFILMCGVLTAVMVAWIS